MLDEICMIEDEQLPDDRVFQDFIRKYQQMSMLYESAVKFVTTRLDVLRKENKASGRPVAVREVQSRLKSLESISDKLRRKDVPLSIHSIWKYLNDVAGVRVICEYINDIYYVRNVLVEENHIKLLKEKDYISNPKPNGYRSLHLVVNVPILLQNGVQHIKCEIQLRTTAMDSWAALEHNLRYKKGRKHDTQIDNRLRLCSEMLYKTDVEMQSIATDMGIIFT